MRRKNHVHPLELTTDGVGEPTTSLREYVNHIQPSTGYIVLVHRSFGSNLESLKISEICLLSYYVFLLAMEIAGVP
jgi:hypothetical protein